MRPLVRLLRFLAPARGQALLATLLGVAAIATNTGLLATGAYLVSAAALHPPLVELSVAIYLVRLCGVSRAFLRYGERLVSHDVTFRLLARLRTWLYGRLAPLATGQLLAYRSADLLARLVRDVEETQNLFQHLVAPAAVATLVGGLACAVLWLVNPALGITTLGVCLALGLGIPPVSHVLARAAGRQQVVARAALDVEITDCLQGLPDLLAFGQAREHAERLAALDRELGRAQQRTAVVSGLRVALNDVVERLGAWLVLLLAIPLVATDGLQAVYLATLVLVMLGAAEGIRPVSQAAQQLGRTRAAAERLWEVADQAPVLSFPDDAPVSASPTPLLELDRVSFAYDGEPVLREVSLALWPGRKVAVVGPSGAGKSTLLGLAARVWDPTAGQVRLGGRDLRDYPRQALAQTIGIVTQDAYLFSGTISDNLRLARATATKEEMRYALQRVGLNDLVARLPDGLDTWIGDQGVALAGGERQRVALARAFLLEAPVLLLDEVTAHLDPLTEEVLLDAVDDLTRARALLLVTHRLVRLERMDEVLVLDAGRIVERGTHAHLRRSGGLYQRLLAVQEQVLAGSRVEAL